MSDKHSEIKQQDEPAMKKRKAATKIADEINALRNMFPNRRPKESLLSLSKMCTFSEWDEENPTPIPTEESDYMHKRWILAHTFSTTLEDYEQTLVHYGLCKERVDALVAVYQDSDQLDELPIWKYRKALLIVKWVYTERVKNHHKAMMHKIRSKIRAINPGTPSAGYIIEAAWVSPKNCQDGKIYEVLPDSRGALMMPPSDLTFHTKVNLPKYTTQEKISFMQFTIGLLSEGPPEELGPSDTWEIESQWRQELRSTYLAEHPELANEDKQEELAEALKEYEDSEEALWRKEDMEARLLCDQRESYTVSQAAILSQTDLFIIKALRKCNVDSSYRQYTEGSQELGAIGADTATISGWPSDDENELGTARGNAPSRQNGTGLTADVVDNFGELLTGFGLLA
jgi:hypothetical protein